jgi:membrane protease YdiL (CAAX protease family)
VTEKFQSESNRIVGAAFAFVVFLYVGWIGAWFLERFLEKHIGVMTTDIGLAMYWLSMKFLLWIVPAVVLIHLSGRTLWEVLEGGRTRSLFAWGGGVGLLLGAITLVVKLASDRPLFSSSFGWPLFNAVLVSPVVEEIAFRGAVLGALLRRFPFVISNLLTALFFLGAHLPGWWFQGRLAANLVNPVGGALSIFLLGLVFGYVAHKSRSVTAGILTHLLNNLLNS